MRSSDLRTLARLLVALGIGLAGPGLLASCAPSVDIGTGSASCAAVIEHDAAIYVGTGDLRRTPGTTGRTLEARIPPCNDTGGQDATVGGESVQVEELRDIAPRVAVLFNDSIYVRDGEELPDSARAWFRSPR